MGQLEIKLKGFEGIAKMLAELPDKFEEKAVKTEMKAAAQVVVDRVKANLEAHGNIRSRLLINSIGAVGTINKDGTVTVRVGVLKNFTHKQQEKREIQNKSRADQSGDSYAFYGIILELGNSHERAQPFLLPAMDETKDQYLEELGNGLQNRLTKAIESLK